MVLMGRQGRYKRSFAVDNVSCPEQRGTWRQELGRRNDSAFLDLPDSRTRFYGSVRGCLRGELYILNIVAASRRYIEIILRIGHGFSPLRGH
jgi:hypothetical protein